jgi:phenylalanyl-tRNA synthetase beta chain
MKISLNELRKTMKIDLPNGQIKYKLFLAGIKLKSVVEKGKKLKDIITVKVTKIEKHADADKLVVTQCSDGENSYQVVTAATNLEEGVIVPLCLPGGKLIDGTKIKETTIRGMDSYGMYCSEEELGLAEKADGILILDKKVSLGVNYIEYAKLQDMIIELEDQCNEAELMQKITAIIKA